MQASKHNTYIRRKTDKKVTTWIPETLNIQMLDHKMGHRQIFFLFHRSSQIDNPLVISILVSKVYLKIFRQQQESENRSQNKYEITQH